MISLSYSKSLDAVVARTMIEDPSLLYAMDLSKTGVLSIKHMFIEETRSYSSLPNAKIALTQNGDLYARFFIELGSFDDSLCAVVLLPLTASAGGGSTFDCYSVQSNITSLQQAGTNIGTWIIGDSPFGTDSGDTFDSYISENPISSSLVDGLYIGTWIIGDSPFGTDSGDTFDSYISENPLVSSLVSGSYIGTWNLGDGP